MLPNPEMDSLGQEVLNLVHSRINGVKGEDLPLVRYDRYSTQELQEYLKEASRSAIDALVAKRNRVKNYSVKVNLYEIQLRIENGRYASAESRSRKIHSSDVNFLLALGIISELKFIENELQDPFRQLTSTDLSEYDQDRVLQELFEGIQRNRQVASR